MDKFFSVVIPVLGIALIIAAMLGYTHITASGGSQLTNPTVLKDKKYLSANQNKYADCHYTIELGDFSIATVTNKYFNQGVGKEVLENLEKQFKEKYENECRPLLDEYRARYTLYLQHKQEAAEAELSQLDKWLGNEAEVLLEPSPIFSLYQEHDPKSLQHPTNPDAKMLYTQDDYDKYVGERI
jgi:hypothetical protein